MSPIPPAVALACLTLLLAACAPPPPPPVACAGMAYGRPWPGLYPPGCANAWNLAMMVERPADLRRGRDPGPPLADSLARAVDRHVRRLDLLPPQAETSPFIAVTPAAPTPAPAGP